MTTSVHRKEWTREHLLVAFRLYCEIPFGKMHARNPQVIDIAKAMGRTPSSLAMKLTNIASLDPAIRMSGRKGLTGATRADREMWKEMSANWIGFSVDSEAAEESLPINFDQSRQESKNQEGSYSYIGLTRSALTKVRIGQSLFRKSVLSAYDFRCCITGLSHEGLLVASHIVPWRSDIENRMNPRNGLCLSAIHDRAFDCGFITLDSSLRVVLSSKLRTSKEEIARNLFIKYEGRKITLPEKFIPEAAFIEYHRREIFLG